MAKAFKGLVTPIEYFAKRGSISDHDCVTQYLFSNKPKKSLGQQ